MIHQIEPKVDNLHGKLSRERAPILEIASGDTLVAGTRCCFWSEKPAPTPNSRPATIALADRKDPENDIGNCLVGPVAIRGAKTGMTLEVEIGELAIGGYGTTVAGGESDGRSRAMGIPEETFWMTWEFSADKKTARNTLGHVIPTRPFLGCLGVAPELPGYHNNLAPHRGGGNMDCRDLVPGSKLYLPVLAPGALFSFGDGHAAQGDGEICNSAIECPMERVELTVKLLDDMPLQWPIAKTPAGWIAFGFHPDLNEAILIAMNGILDLMTAQLKISRVEALTLASMVVDLHITQVVNPVPGVHAIWRESMG